MKRLPTTHSICFLWPLVTVQHWRTKNWNFCWRLIACSSTLQWEDWWRTVILCPHMDFYHVGTWLFGQKLFFSEKCECKPFMLMATIKHLLIPKSWHMRYILCWSTYPLKDVFVQVFFLKPSDVTTSHSVLRVQYCSPPLSLNCIHAAVEHFKYHSVF